MIRRQRVSSRSHPKPPLNPIAKRIMPFERRIALQSRLCNDIPHYAAASLMHTHRALELVERAVSSDAIPDILDSDEKIVGYLFGRAQFKYGEWDGPFPAWWNEAAHEGWAYFVKFHTKEMG